VTKVKRVKLGNLSKIQPGFKDSDGQYNSETDTIYVDADLPSQGIASSGSVLQHERGHALLHKSSLAACFPNGYEEQFCELYSLATSEASTLTSLERTCRKIIFRGATWKRKADRARMVETILVLCQVQPNRELMTKLGGE
jgi:hypothetical protein